MSHKKNDYQAWTAEALHVLRSKSELVHLKPAMATCQQSPDDFDADSTAAYLALAKEDTERAIAHLETACADSRVDPSVRRVALDALRDALAAIEAEMEAGNAKP